MKINNSCDEYGGKYDQYTFFYHEWKNEHGAYDNVPKENSEEFLNWSDKHKF